MHFIRIRIGEEPDRRDPLDRFVSRAWACVAFAVALIVLDALAHLLGVV